MKSHCAAGYPSHLPFATPKHNHGRSALHHAAHHKHVPHHYHHSTPSTLHSAGAAAAATRSCFFTRAQDEGSGGSCAVRVVISNRFMRAMWQENWFRKSLMYCTASSTFPGSGGKETFARPMREKKRWSVRLNAPRDTHTNTHFSLCAWCANV